MLLLKASLFTLKFFSTFKTASYCSNSVSGVLLKELGQNSNLSVENEVLRRNNPTHIRNLFLFVLSFNVAHYFQLKKLVFF